MNSKSVFDLLFYHRPGTLQASQLSFALIQFHLNEFENMMLLILEQLLLNLFSINKVVLKKTFSISFGLNTIEKSFQDMLSSKNQWREKPISFVLKTVSKQPLPSSWRCPGSPSSSPPTSSLPGSSSWSPSASSSSICSTQPRKS